MGAGESYAVTVERLDREIATAESKIRGIQQAVHRRYQNGRRAYETQQLHRTGVELKPGYGAPVFIKSKGRRPDAAG